MAGTNDRFLRECQHLFPIVSQRIGIRNFSSTHRTSKNRVSNDGNRLGQATNEIRHPANRMATRQPGFNRESANMENAA
jgi:hypothetical protein